MFLKSVTIPVICATINVICVLSYRNEDDPKIIGGSEGNKEDYPYVVSLRTSNNNHFCGGTLINYQFIITAAHCAKGYLKTSPNIIEIIQGIFSEHAKFVVIGSDSLDSGGTNYNIKSIYIHPEYDEHLIRNDIAILKIEKQAVYKSSFPERMITNLSDYENPCFVMGWGLTSPGGNLSNKFKIAQVQPISAEKCQQEWKELYNPKVICTNSLGNAACNGDSGGPLICEDKFAGIVSFGKPCARGKPDVFTAVSSYNEWIDTIINQ